MADIPEAAAARRKAAWTSNKAKSPHKQQLKEKQQQQQPDDVAEGMTPESLQSEKTAQSLTPTEANEEEESKRREERLRIAKLKKEEMLRKRKRPASTSLGEQSAKKASMGDFVSEGDDDFWTAMSQVPGFGSESAMTPKGGRGKKDKGGGAVTTTPRARRTLEVDAVRASPRLNAARRLTN